MTLTVSDVSFHYPEREVLLSNLSLRAESGQIVGIRGRSGCGKSTLLKLLAGFLKPTTGHIRWQGRPVPEPGCVAMVFQDAVGSLNPRWSIGKSIAEGLFRLPRDERHRRVATALASVGLADVNPRLLPGQLSGGQCQRVAIARVHASPPALLLADEPTSALDASVGAGILRLLRDLANLPTAIVLVSHDRAVLSVLADRVLVMDNGRLQEINDHAAP